MSGAKLMHAHLEQEKYAAAPGDKLTFRVLLTNDSSATRTYQMRVVGLDPAIVSLPPAVAPLAAGESIAVPILAQLPLAFAGGDHRIAVEITSSDPAERPSLVEMTLSIGSISDLLMSLGPRNVRGSWRGKFQTNLANKGHDPIVVDLEGDGEHLKFKFRQNPVTVRGGESVRIRTYVRGPRPIGGQGVNRPFTISASSGSAPSHVVGTFVRRSIIPVGLQRSFAFAAILLLWAGGLFLAWQRWGDVGEDANNSDQIAADGSDGDLGDGSGDGSASGDGSGSGDAADGSGDGASDEADADDPDAEFRSTLGGFVKSGESGVDGGVTIILEPVALDTVESSGITLVGFKDSDNSGSKVFGGRAGLARGLPDDSPEISTTQSDDDGEWGFAGIDRRGTYRLDFAKPGYTNQSFVVTFPEEGPFELDVEMEPGDGAVSGTISGPREDGTIGIIGSADIEISDGTIAFKTTSSSVAPVGSYQVEGLSTPGRYLLTVSVPGAANSVVAVDLTEGLSIVQNVTLLPGVIDLQGVVSSGGDGIGGITVTATDGDFVATTTTFTDELAGTYILPKLPLGRTYLVTFEGDGFLPEQLSYLAATDDTKVNITMTPSTFTIVGNVSAVDPSDGSPLGNLSGAGIIVARDGADVVLKATSDDDGGFDLAGLDTGTYVLTFTKFQHMSASVLVELVDPTSPPDPLAIVLDFDPTQGTVESTGVLVGTVRSANDNSTLADVVVIIRPTGSDPLCNIAPTPANSTPCDIDFGDVVTAGPGIGGTTTEGLYSIGEVPVGIHQVTVMHYSHQPITELRSFGLGTRDTLNAVLFELGSINGTVTETDGTAIAGPFGIVSITANPAYAVTDGTCSSGGSQSFVNGDNDGSYDYDVVDLVPCHYIALFRANTYIEVGVAFEIVFGQPGEVIVDAVLAKKPQAVVSVYVPTTGTDVDLSSGTDFQLTVQPTHVTGITVTSSPLGTGASAGIDAVIDSGNEVFEFQVSGAADPTYLPPGTYRFDVVAASGYRTNNATMVLSAGDTTNLSIPLSPIQPDFGGSVFYRTPDGVSRSIPGSNVQISANQVITEFEEGGFPASPFNTLRDNVFQVSSTAGGAATESTWNSTTLGGFNQVWDTADYGFTHPDFLPSTANTPANVAITVDDTGVTAAGDANIVDASVTSGLVDVELDPRDGTVTGGVLVVSADSVANVFGPSGLDIAIDNTNNPTDALANLTVGNLGSSGSSIRSGYFSSTGREPGNYQIDAIHPQFAVLPGGNATSSGYLDPNKTLWLDGLELYELGKITLEVRDGGAPLVGATVLLRGTATSHTTGVDGRATFAGLAVNSSSILTGTTYIFDVDRPGYDPTAAIVSVIPGGFFQPSTTTPDPDNILPIFLEELQVITGTVNAVNVAGGSATQLSGATITYRHIPVPLPVQFPPLSPCADNSGTLGTTTTDATTSGTNFTIAGPVGDYYICSISATNYTTTTPLLTGTAALSGPHNLGLVSASGAINEITPAYELVALGAVIDGAVVNEVGDPIASATICILPSTSSAVVIPGLPTDCPGDSISTVFSDSSGDFTFPPLAPGDYKIYTFATGHLLLIRDFSITPGGTISFTGGNAGAIALLRQSSTITGRVVIVNNAIGGSGFSCTNNKVLGTADAAEVTLFGGGTGLASTQNRGTIAAGTNGTFLFTDLEDGDYSFAVNGPIHTGVSVPYTGHPGTTISNQGPAVLDNLNGGSAGSAQCPIMVPANDGAIALTVFTDNNGDGIQNGAETLVGAGTSVQLQIFRPEDLTIPVADIQGVTTTTGTVLFTGSLNSVAVAPLSLATANSFTDPADTADQYVLRLSSPTSAFVSIPGSAAVTPGATTAAQLGVFQGAEVTGIMQKQTGKTTTVVVTEADTAATVRIRDSGGTLVGTTDVFSNDGRWSVNVASGDFGTGPYAVELTMGDTTIADGDDFVDTFDTATGSSSGTLVVGQTVDVGTNTIKKKGIYDINTNVDGVTIRVKPVGSQPTSPPFSVPTVDGVAMSGSYGAGYTITLASDTSDVDVLVDTRQKYDILGSHADFDDKSSNDQKIDIGQTKAINLTLVTTLGGFKATVKDPYGANVSGALVELMTGPTVIGFATTNSFGIAFVEGVPGATTYDVRITSTAWPDQTFTAFATVTKNVAAPSPVNMSLAGGDITVDLTLVSGSSIPTAGFTITVAGPDTPTGKTITSSGGSVNFPALKDGSYTVSVGAVTGYTHILSPTSPVTVANTASGSSPNVNITTTYSENIAVTINQPDATALTTGTVVLTPGNIAMSYSGAGGIWTASNVAAPAADYDIDVSASGYPDETFNTNISFSKAGDYTAPSTQTLAGGSVTIGVSGATSVGQTFVISLNSTLPSPPNKTITTTSTTAGADTVTFNGLPNASWTAGVVPTGSETGWQGSLSGITIGATTATGGGNIPVSNPAPVVSGVSIDEATIYNESCAAAVHSGTVTVTVTDASGDLVSVVLTSSDALAVALPMTAGAGNSYSVTFNPDTFTGNPTATLTVTATDSDSNTTGTTTVELSTPCP